MRTHGLSDTDTYKVWTAMIQRCQNPKCRSFSDYGGRGIGIAQAWLVFENFVRDMGLRPPAATIDRIDNSLGYEKSNCQWSSMELQNQNKRSVRLNHDSVREIRRRVEGGERARVVARELGLPESTVSMVVNRHTWKNVA